MTKKHLLTTLTVSAVLLSQAGFVSADEVTPVDPTAPSTEVVVPSTETTTQPIIPSTDTTTPSTDTGTSDSGTAVPVDPTTPSTDPSTDGSQGKDTSGDTVVPDTGNQDKDDADKTDDSQPNSEPQGKDTSGNNVNPDGSTTVPTTDGGVAQVTPDKTVPTNNPNISADIADKAGASQVGTTSTVTGQVVQNVTATTPVQTNMGVSIVSTKNGQVVLSDGSTVAPETIGAVTNADKTITVTKVDGTKTTLPETGEKATGILSVIGMLLLGVVSAIMKKKML